ncbi:MAG TPA: thioredoxin family protein [Fibrobacteraceae bacterium]|nr:thioredoxin family protein [Fibrobacteraceae bacterium]
MTRFSNICFLFFLNVLASAIGASGQTFDLGNKMRPPQMQLQFEEGPLAVGSSLQVQVHIDSGWHINSDKPLDDFLMPSHLDVEAEGIEFDSPLWPEADTLRDTVLQSLTLVFAGDFTIAVPVHALGQDYDSTTVQATLHYQACSGSICMAPGKVTAQIGQMPLLDLKKNDPGPDPVPEASSSSSLFLLLLFAFLGGLILNLMPCVLPVLSIKALSLAKHARESRARLLAMGCTMTAGILVSFWTLAILVVILQKTGTSVGWGFQFQNPTFLAAMIVLVTLFALNLFGVFEVWLPSSAQTGMSRQASRSGFAGSFWNGVLMTLLSTPCSAPFLGTAMGFAFSQPPLWLFLFFTVAGFGLAFPYLMLSLLPATLRWIPHPGPWMERFRQFLGFLLMATAVWLLWVLGRMGGAEVMGAMLLLLLLIGIVAWLLGCLAPPGSAFWKVIFLWALLLGTGVVVWRTLVAPSLLASQAEGPSSGMELDALGWIPWSPSTIAELQAKGKTIFVDFTADWCLTCKANEKAVLAQDTIRVSMEQFGVARVKADFTRTDPAIAAALQSFGRSGVPLYVIYPSMDPKHPIVLNEILSTDGLLDALMRAGPSQGGF